MAAQEAESKRLQVPGIFTVFLYVFFFHQVTIVMTVESLNHKDLTKMSSASVKKEGAEDADAGLPSFRWRENFQREECINP